MFIYLLIFLIKRNYGNKLNIQEIFHQTCIITHSLKYIQKDHFSSNVISFKFLTHTENRLSQKYYEEIS